MASKAKPLDELDRTIAKAALADELAEALKLARDALRDTHNDLTSEGYRSGNSTLELLEDGLDAVQSALAKYREAVKAHCKNGHKFTDQSTRVLIDKRGVVNRACRICIAARKKRARQQSAAEKE